MKHKRLAIGIAVATLLVAVGLAAGWNFVPVGPAQAQGGGATATPDIAVLRHQKLVTAAKGAGIDITGMTDDQIIAALQAKAGDNNGGKDKATTGPTAGQASASSEPSHQDLVAAAQQQGIDITGMTDAQILAALRHNKLVIGAQRAGINITGMTDDQILAALQAQQGGAQGGGQKK